MSIWDSMALNAPHTEREIGDESNIKKPDIAMRCAECDCANGGDECNWFGSPMAIITALRAEIDRCHERLEIKRMHRMNLATGETTPVDIPLQERASLPDGIDCRDETIRLLRDNIETLRSNNAQLLAQLRELAQDGKPAPGSTTESENATCPSAGGFGAATWQNILTAIAAEKANWPHNGVMHDAARMACDNIAARIKQLMGDA